MGREAPPPDTYVWWLQLFAHRHPDLTVRDLRPENGDEVASMCLQHGENKYDDLLDCHANVPFRRLFNATKEIEVRSKPLLDKLGT